MKFFLADASMAAKRMKPERRMRLKSEVSFRTKLECRWMNVKLFGASGAYEWIGRNAAQLGINSLEFVLTSKLLWKLQCFGYSIVQLDILLSGLRWAIFNCSFISLVSVINFFAMFWCLSKACLDDLNENKQTFFSNKYAFMSWILAYRLCNSKIIIRLYHQDWWSEKLEEEFVFILSGRWKIA